MSEDLRINVFNKGEKTEQLTCNWCGEPHAVEAGYKKETLKRGAEQIKEHNIPDITPEETWTCGKCMLVLNGMAPDALKTDCHDHPIPTREEWNERKNNSKDV